MQSKERKGSNFAIWQPWIKDRSRAIFGTGDALRVVTVSANSGFVRAARGQGLELAVELHESRALTEGKMTLSRNED